MTTDSIIDKAAAELVQELIHAAGTDGGQPWLQICRRKLQRVVEQVESAENHNPALN